MIQSANNLQRVNEAIALAVKPSSNAPIVDWVSDNVLLVDGKSTYYDPSITPWAKAPLELLTDHSTREINLLWSPGLGKSAMMEAATNYIVVNQPAPYLICGQSASEIQLWFEHRLKGSLKQCEAIKPLYPTDRRADKANSIKFPHMAIWTASAESINDLQGKSCRYVFADEIWTYPAGRVGELKARTHQRANRKCLFISQASEQETDWHDQCKTGKQLEWQFPCDGCGKYHAYDIEHFKYQESEEINPQVIRDTTRLVCPDCGHEHGDNPATRRRLADNAKYVDISDTPYDSEVATLIVNQFAKISDRWADSLIRNLRAKESSKSGYLQPIKTYQQKELVKWWSEDTNIEVIPFKRGEYRMDDPPDITRDEGLRILAIDIQKSAMWCLIRQYYKDGSSKLIDYRRVLTYPDIVELQKQYTVLNSCTVIDIAYNTENVCKFCADNKYIGIDGKTYSKTYTHHKKTKNKRYTVELPYSEWKRKETPSGKHCFYLNYNGKAIKDIVYTQRTNDAIAFEVGEDIDKYTDYVDQIDAEQKRLITNKKTGKKYYDYVRTKRDNHAVDLETQCVVLAMHYGIPILSESNNINNDD